MPCRCEGADEELSAQRNRELTDLTAMLCWICEQTDAAKILQNPALAGWWETHQAEDKRRKARERASERTAEVRRNAAAKLTPEERAALGIDKDGY